eukprot:Lankesteria_metandrocarpae@DN27_c0_g1_i1.p1
MGICRARRFKHRLTGGRMPVHQKKKKHEMGRASCHTKLGHTCVRPVRVRGGGKKFRALRLDSGSFSWASEGITRKTRIVAVVYNATSNELVRTNTITKSTIVQIDAVPFKQWYTENYGLELVKKKVGGGADEGETKGDVAVEHAVEGAKGAAKRLWKIDPSLGFQIGGGRVLACIASRPGQCGRANGYILEGKELEFYKKKLEKKKR